MRAFARERQKGVRRVALKPRGTAGPRRKAPRGRAAGDSHRQSLPFRRPSPSRSTSTRHVKVRLHARSPTLRRRKVARGSATQPLPRHAAPLTALASAAARAQHSPDMPVLLQVPRQLGCRQLCVDTRSRCRVPREILYGSSDSDDITQLPSMSLHMTVCIGLARRMPLGVPWPSCRRACLLLIFGSLAHRLPCARSPLCAAHAAVFARPVCTAAPASSGRCSRPPPRAVRHLVAVQAAGDVSIVNVLLGVDVTEDLSRRRARGGSAAAAGWPRAAAAAWPRDVVGRPPRAVRTRVGAVAASRRRARASPVRGTRGAVARSSEALRPGMSVSLRL